MPQKVHFVALRMVLRYLVLSLPPTIADPAADLLSEPEPDRAPRRAAEPVTNRAVKTRRLGSLGRRLQRGP